MAKREYLGEFELMVLLAVVRLGDGAYGVPLAQELSNRRGRGVSVGAVYAALERLELKGMVRSKVGEATPERGGRAKRYFRVTEAGVASMRAMREVLEEMWTGLPGMGGQLA